MTLLEIAEYLATTQQTLYDQYGRCVLRDVADWNDFHKALFKLADWKYPSPSFSISSVDDNVTFILLVHECISNK